MNEEENLAPSKRGRGRPAFEPTDEHRRTVETMKVAGMTEEVIADCLGIAEQTLRKYFREELDSGKVKTDTRITDAIVRQALAGNTALLIWYSKARMGWRETVINENTGPGGGPQEHKVTWEVVDPKG